MPVPPRQTNYQKAFASALRKARSASHESLRRLGAEPVRRPAAWSVPVLNTSFTADFEAGVVLEKTSGTPVSLPWAILTLRYLSAGEACGPSSRWVAFRELEPAAAVYAPVFKGRVEERFLAGAGASAKRFLSAARSAGGAPSGLGSAAAEFPVFPEVPVAVVRFEGDEELPPRAAFLFRDNITAVFSLEDVVVLSERLASKLAGGAW